MKNKIINASLMGIIACLPSVSSAADAVVDEAVQIVAEPETAPAMVEAAAYASLVGKYVRNVSRPNGFGKSIKIGDELFYERSGDVKADTDDVLEYAIVISSSDTDFSSVTVSDSMPPYTEYIAQSTSINALQVEDIGEKSPVIDKVLVNDARSGLSSGMAQSGFSAVVMYRVRVNLMMDLHDNG